MAVEWRAIICPDLTRDAVYRKDWAQGWNNMLIGRFGKQETSRSRRWRSNLLPVSQYVKISAQLSSWMCWHLWHLHRFSWLFQHWGLAREAALECISTIFSAKELLCFYNSHIAFIGGIYGVGCQTAGIQILLPRSKRQVGVTDSSFSRRL